MTTPSQKRSKTPDVPNVAAALTATLERSISGADLARPIQKRIPLR